MSPAALVARAAGAGLTTIAVTDHDTVAGIEEAAAAGLRAGLRVIPGIEITAVENGRDVHILGYFLDPENGALAHFLVQQRRDRIERVRQMGERLRALGVALHVEPLVERAGRAGTSIGRPAIADALVAAGHAADRRDAFDRLLAEGRPAFVPRAGARAGNVIRVIHEAGGLASLAHPGVIDRDASIPTWAAEGLDALEVWHSDHGPELQQRYAALTDRLGLLRTGGSDYHGEGLHRTCEIGGVSLPAGELARLEARVVPR